VILCFILNTNLEQYAFKNDLLIQLQFDVILSMIYGLGHVHCDEGTYTT